MPSFAGEVAASLPSRLTLPPEFQLTLEWMEANGHVHTYRNQPRRYGSLYPTTLEPRGTSLVTFQICDPDYIRHWMRGDAGHMARLAPIIRTGGDGSHAALWLDDQGRQRFVHLGSGSTMMWVLCDSAIDMLRLIAIGYDELCWDDTFAMAPKQAREHNGFSGGFVPPLEFRSFVETAFGVKTPATASAIVKRTANMDADRSDDPFWTWVRALDTK